MRIIIYTLINTTHIHISILHRQHHASTLLHSRGSRSTLHPYTPPTTSSHKSTHISLWGYGAGLRQKCLSIILRACLKTEPFCFSLSLFSIHFLNIYPFLFHSLFLPLFLSHTSIYPSFLIPAFTLHSQFTPTTLYSIHRLLTNQAHITNTTPFQ